MADRPNYYLPSVDAYEAIAAAVKSGAALTLTVEQAEAIYRDMRAIREANAPRNCATCGKPVGLPTNRYMPANVCAGDKIYHGWCAPGTCQGTSALHGQEKA